MKRNIYITALLALIVISGLSFTLPESVFLPYLLKRFNEYQQQNPKKSSMRISTSHFISLAIKYGYRFIFAKGKPYNHQN